MVFQSLCYDEKLDLTLYWLQPHIQQLYLPDIAILIAILLVRQKMCLFIHILKLAQTSSVFDTFHVN